MSLVKTGEAEGGKGRGTGTCKMGNKTNFSSARHRLAGSYTFFCCFFFVCIKRIFFVLFDFYLENVRAYTKKKDSLRSELTRSFSD